MFSYYNFIKSMYTEREFEDLLEGKPLKWDWKEKIDLSLGSGFHIRQRKRKIKNEG